MERNGRKAVVVKDREIESDQETQIAKNVNNVRKFRESQLMSKAELARKSGLSALTIDRIESGHNCRMDTKRKIILALGLRLSDKDQVFGEKKEEPDQDA